MVKGDEIVSDRGRPEVLAPVWRDKIARYRRFWQMRSSDCSACPSLETLRGPIPCIWERLRDRVEYRFWRVFDQCTAVAFSFAPIQVLKRYRERKAPGTNPVLNRASRERD